MTTFANQFDLRNSQVPLDPAVSGEYGFQIAVAQVALAEAVARQKMTGLDAREIATQIKVCTDAGGVHRILGDRLPVDIVEAAKREAARQAHEIGSAEIEIPPRLRFDRPENLSTSGGMATGFEFSGIGNGIYTAVTPGGLRYLVIRNGSAQSFGPPSYDLSYLMRGNKDLRNMGWLDMRTLPSTRGSRGEQISGADSGPACK
jgi:hypothetical protein